MKIIVVSQKNSPLVLLIKLVTFSKWNHVAILDEKAGKIYENDFGYQEHWASQYPHKWKISKKSHSTLTPAQQKAMIKELEKEPYRIMWNLTVIPIVGKIFEKFLKPGNCVYFACSVMGLGKSYWTKAPAWFS